MYRPTAMELKILRAVRELREADPPRVAPKAGMGSVMADYLCRYLAGHGLLQNGNGRRIYKLTAAGQGALEDAFARTLNILRQREGEVLETLAKVRLP
ncbi:MAG: hypothetical protein ACE5IA_05225 [Dehalococcoidia bacterium]